MPCVGLALGGGSARGFAHIGILQVLEEEGIEIDMIAGTSIGSIFGALYLSGCDLYILEKLSKEFRQNSYMDVAVPRLGLLKGDKIEALIRLLTKNYTFEKLSKPFFAVAVDLQKGERVILEKGMVAEAVRASISIPGIFVPKKIGASFLVDGAVLELVPVNVLREKGADKIIAVDVRFGGSEGRIFEVHNIFDVILQADEFAKRNSIEKARENADVFIQPDLGEFNPTDFNNAWKTIAIGRAAAKEAIPEIKSLIKRI